ncbi:MAG: hypothetical protein JXB30_09445 [Anaerolineae bacterium]|nr:hypothetical protein [Anaerolineae bacterium]
MPQLVKGGKWVFGWVVVGPHREIKIPPEAYTEYGFQAGEQVHLLPGSRRSGGFSVGRHEALAQAKIPFERRVLGQGVIGEDRQIELPPEVDVKPGDRLLAARGSGVALGFVQHGPIYEEALKHPEIEVFKSLCD